VGPTIEQAGAMPVRSMNVRGSAIFFRSLDHGRELLGSWPELDPRSIGALRGGGRRYGRGQCMGASGGSALADTLLHDRDRGSRRGRASDSPREWRLTSGDDLQ